MTIPADDKGPKAVSTVCSECGSLIKPDALKDATAHRVDRADGTWALQYDHNECPRWLATNPSKEGMAALMAMME